MANLLMFDLDMEEDVRKVYIDAKDTIKYLEDLVKSIEARVLNGEYLEDSGFEIVSKPGNRFITKPGEKYLVKLFGEDKIMEKKIVTFAKLDTLLTKQDYQELYMNGFMDYKKATNKVELK